MGKCLAPSGTCLYIIGNLMLCHSSRFTFTNVGYDSYVGSATNQGSTVTDEPHAVPINSLSQRPVPYARLHELSLPPINIQSLNTDLCTKQFTELEFVPKKTTEIHATQIPSSLLALSPWEFPNLGWIYTRVQDQGHSRNRGILLIESEYLNPRLKN